MPTEVQATLRTLRKVSPKPLTRIAEECGVTTKTVLAWENGAAPPTINHAAAHAKALGIDLEEYKALWQLANDEWLAAHAAATVAGE